MPCYHPLKGYRSKTVNPSGKRSIVFNAREGYQDLPIDVPCGQCIGCRLERSRQWAIRCVHEASLSETNCFLTLTYSEDNLPKDGSLKLEDFQNFMKALRNQYSGQSIRYFHCGEYGETTGRPHYHAVIFNFDFPDKKPWRETKQGHQIWRSETLESKLWTKGLSEIGSLTFESAAYVARYILKKRTGPTAEEYYDGKKPEYTTMSRRPGIGKGWFEKFYRETFPLDKIVLRGKELKPPKFYLGQFEIINPALHEKVKAIRKADAHANQEKNSPKNLNTAEAVKKIRTKALQRGL